MANTATLTRKQTIGFDRTPQDGSGKYNTFRLFADFSAEVAEFTEVHGSAACNPCHYSEVFEAGTDEAEMILKIVKKPNAIHRYQ